MKCKAETLQGQQCPFNSKDGGDYCGTHIKKSKSNDIVEKAAKKIQKNVIKDAPKDSDSRKQENPNMRQGNPSDYKDRVWKHNGKDLYTGKKREFFYSEKNIEDLNHKVYKLTAIIPRRTGVEVDHMFECQMAMAIVRKSVADCCLTIAKRVNMEKIARARLKNEINDYKINYNNTTAAINSSKGKAAREWVKRYDDGGSVKFVDILEDKCHIRGNSSRKICGAMQTSMKNIVKKYEDTEDEVERKLIDELEQSIRYLGLE